MMYAHSCRAAHEVACRSRSAGGPHGEVHRGICRQAAVPAGARECRCSMMSCRASAFASSPAARPAISSSSTSAAAAPQDPGHRREGQPQGHAAGGLRDPGQGAARHRRGGRGQGRRSQEHRPRWASSSRCTLRPARASCGPRAYVEITRYLEQLEAAARARHRRHQPAGRRERDRRSGAHQRQGGRRPCPHGALAPLRLGDRPGLSATATHPRHPLSGPERRAHTRPDGGRAGGGLEGLWATTTTAASSGC